MWKYLFSENILKRGHSLDKKNIININIGNNITATILGSQEYKTSILNNFSSMECSCPCEGFYCKHLVLLFLYLQDNNKDIINNFYDSNLFNKSIEIKLKKENIKLIHNYENKLNFYFEKIEDLKKENIILNKNITKDTKSVEKYNKSVEKYNDLKIKYDIQKIKISNLKLKIEELKLELKTSKHRENTLIQKLAYYIFEESRAYNKFKEKQKTSEELYNQKQARIDNETMKKLPSNLKKYFDNEFSWIDKLEDNYCEYEIVDHNLIEQLNDELLFIKEGSIKFDEMSIYGDFYIHLNTETRYFYDPIRDLYYSQKNN